MSPDAGAPPEYQPLLDGTQSYDDDEWISALQAAGGPGPTVPERAASEQYLQRHWLDLTDLLAGWLPLLDQVFRPLPAVDRQVDGAPLHAGPEAGFAEGWTALAWDAGAPLSAETYAAVQGLMAAAGDTCWVLVERPHHGRWPDAQAFRASPVPLLRLRFQPTTTWTEVNGDRADLRDPLQAATSVSGDLFTLGREDCFLLGDSGSWGLAYRGGAWRGQCVLGIDARLRAVADGQFAAVLADHGAPEVLRADETTGPASGPTGRG